MIYFAILASKHFIMNPACFKRSSNHEKPPTELDMTNFLELLPDDIGGKIEVWKNGVRTYLRLIDSKTDGGTDSTEISSVSRVRPNRKEKVRTFDVEFVGTKYSCKYNLIYLYE